MCGFRNVWMCVCMDFVMFGCVCTYGFRNVWVCVCVCVFVCMGFVMFGCVCVCVCMGFVMCVCVCLCVCMGFVMFGCVHVWVLKYVGVLVICVLVSVFTPCMLLSYLFIIPTTAYIKNL